MSKKNKNIKNDGWKFVNEDLEEIPIKEEIAHETAQERFYREKFEKSVRRKANIKDWLNAFKAIFILLLLIAVVISLAGGFSYSLGIKNYAIKGQQDEIKELQRQMGYLQDSVANLEFEPEHPKNEEITNLYNRQRFWQEDRSGGIMLDQN